MSKKIKSKSTGLKKSSIRNAGASAFTGKKHQNVFSKKPPRRSGSLTKLLKKPATAIASIFYDGRACYLRNTGLIAGIDIKYSGTLQGSSDLPDEFMIMEGNYQIIITN